MELVLITILTVIASAVGTMTGFGSSTIMVPILLLSYPLTETLLMVGIIHWFGNLWKVLLFGRGFRWKLVLSFGISGIIATYIGASLTLSISPSILSRLLGSFIIVYVLFLFIKGTFRIRQNLTTELCGGTISGFLAGIFGVGGAVRAAFLAVFDLPKATYIATAGAIALIVDTTRLAKYIWGGSRLDSRILWAMPVFIIASFIGANIARKLVDHIPQKHFRAVVAVFLFLVAMKLLIFPMK